MGRRTPLYEGHIKAGAKMVQFGEWEMPLHYGSQIKEHRDVRKRCGIFDVSHMRIVDLEGEGIQAFLRYLLANDVAKIGEKGGKGLYTCMLNEAGGVIDDLIVYVMRPKWYRMVLNAANGEVDLNWIRKHRDAHAPSVEVSERNDLGLMAIQGPKIPTYIFPQLGEEATAVLNEMRPFHAAQVPTPLGDYGMRVTGTRGVFMSRTGYTGEYGFELAATGETLQRLWNLFTEIGARPCGLGARDTLRLEAGLNLHGNEMDETVTPLEANLGWTVAWSPEDRDFIGRAALEAKRQQGIRFELHGLILEEKGVPRHGQEVRFDTTEEVGQITSGGFSPTLQRGIGMVRIPTEVATPYTPCRLVTRERELAAQIVKLPFVKSGRATFDL